MSKRTERLDSEFRKEIAAILTGPLKDKEPALKGLISVTEAIVAPDLKTAKVYVSVYAPAGEQEESLRIIAENAPFVRRELARVMRLRTVPEITFLPDKSFEYGAKMDDLFSRLHKEGTDVDD